ncbi:uncharacterized protein O3C94_006272 [Discoglossus pictus]
MNFKFTYSIDKDQVDFLDLRLKRDESDAIHTSVYRKPKATNALLKWSSQHHFAQKSGDPYGQYLRHKRNYDTIQQFNEQAKDLKIRFKDRGYPNRILKRAHKRALQADRNTLLYGSTETKNIALDEQEDKSIQCFPLVVPESLEVKSEREEPDTEGHLTTIKTEIVTSNVRDIFLLNIFITSFLFFFSCFNASHPDWIPDRSSPQNLIIVKTEDCSRSLDVSQEVSEEDFEFEFPDLGKFKARKAARTKKNLSSIKVLNPVEKTYTCTKCGKCFKLKWNFQIHCKIHTGEKPYTCTECGKCFRDKHCLHIHHRTHTGEKPFRCTACGKRITQRASLLRHYRVHTGAKPFTCTECGKRFRDKGSLRRHKRIHTGEKPFRCTECRKIFRDKQCLRTHHMIHTGEKPFRCTECGKRFTDRAHLVTHHRIHIGEKHFTCTESGKSASLHRHLVTHRRK